jgi:hypothetical protein
VFSPTISLLTGGFCLVLGNAAIYNRQVRHETYVAGILALASMSSLFAVSANATTTIESVPFTITTSGNYILDGNLVLPKTSQTAITVSVSNVEIDFNGFTLTGKGGPNGNQTAIYCQGFNNVTIQNGTITGFALAVNLQSGANEVVQNLQLLNSFAGALLEKCSYDNIQNCYVEGTGPSNGGVGFLLDTDLGDVVNNNQIANEGDGCFSSSSFGNLFIANQLTNCSYGLQLVTGDKYAGNLTGLCLTPFSGGTAVGDENN